MLLPLYFSLLRAHSSLISTNTTTHATHAHMHTCTHLIQKNSFTYRRRAWVLQKDMLGVCSTDRERERYWCATHSKNGCWHLRLSFFHLNSLLGAALVILCCDALSGKKNTLCFSFFGIMFEAVVHNYTCVCACVSIECFKHFFVFSAQNLRLTHWYHPKCTLCSTKQPNRFNEIQRSVFIIFHWHHAHFYLFLLTFCILKIAELKWIFRVF